MNERRVLIGLIGADIMGSLSPALFAFAAAGVDGVTSTLGPPFASLRGALSFQFGRLSAPRRPQAVHRSRRPIDGTSTSSARFETSTTAERWQFTAPQYAAIVRTPFARMFPSVMGGTELRI